MKILLIGGSGFIGPYVARELIARGHEITLYSRGISKTPLPRMTGTRDELPGHIEEFRKLSPDVIVDFILSSGRQAQLLMNTFRGIAARVVVLSSGDVYRACGILHGLEGGPLQPVPLNEEAELRSSANVYRPELLDQLRSLFPWLDQEYDKIPVERTVMGDPQLPGTVLRLPMVYGPGDYLHRLFPYLKRMDDRRPAILMQEDVAAWRAPRGYVENVAAATVLAILNDRAKRQIYNVAEPESLSEAEWVRRIANAANWNGKIIPLAKDVTPAHLRLPYNTAQHWAYDTRKIREQLGFLEPIDQNTALEKTIAWERANPPAFSPSQFDYAAEDAVWAALNDQTLSP